MYFPFAKDEAGQKAPYKIEKMKYYLIAGEPSGDLHGANLIEGLRKADPEAQFRFWGGDRMAAAGVVNHSLSNFDAVCAVAADEGTIRPEDIQRLKKFRADPSDESWRN